MVTRAGILYIPFILIAKAELVRKLKSLRVYLVEGELMCGEAVQSLLEHGKGARLAGTADSITNPPVSTISKQSETVLMDIRLKGETDGLRTTKIISKKYSRTKVIMFTNFLDKESFTAVAPAESSGYILKNKICESR
jgi:DNA-binding NarL/FixJ family response regulator